MQLFVRKVSLESDRDEMLELLKRNLPDPPELGFDWRYTRNPAGPAWAWFLCEKASGKAVAMTGLFPRPMYVDGKPMLAGQVMHFVVDVAHRSLGPAVLLQRATFEPVNSGEIDFCYDCPPHDQGMSTFVRIGIKASCEITRYAFLLRADEYFRKRAGNAFWTRPVAAAANAVLSFRNINRDDAGLEIRESAVRFGDEYSTLGQSIATTGMVTRRRSANDLNWRYRDNPESKYHVLEARVNGELVACAIFTVQSEGVAGLMELFGREISRVGRPLLAAVIEFCRKQNLFAVHGYCSDQSELAPLFEELGFRPRERTARVVAYAKNNGFANQLLDGNLRWSFSHAELSG